MKFRKNKKGFTIVELIIVIAVIGILTAVMVPTIVHLVNKANKASDEVTVNGLNKALALRKGDASYKKPSTMFETVKGLEEYGYKADSLIAKSDEGILYDLERDEFLMEKSDRFDPDRKAHYWKVQKGVETNQEYNIYALEDFEFEDDETIEVGFDAGESSVSSIEFNTSDSKDVVIRTNGSPVNIGTSTDVCQATVKLHGSVPSSVAYTVNDSLHVFGEVSDLDLESGKAVAEANGMITLKKAAAGTTVLEEENGIVYIPEGTPIGSDGINWTSVADVEKLTNLGYETEIVDNKPVVKANEETKAKNVYTISSKADLLEFREKWNSGSYTSNMPIKLAADIDLSQEAWKPIGNRAHPFYGSFDGGEHTIKGLSNKGYYMDEDDIFTTDSTKLTGAAYGFFGVVGTGNNPVNISNLVFTEVDINGVQNQMCGVVVGADMKAAKVGSYSGDITLTNIEVSGVQIQAVDSVGAIMGKAYTAGKVKVTGCTTNIRLEVGIAKKIAGLVGFASGPSEVYVRNNTVKGDVVLGGYASSVDVTGARGLIDMTVNTANKVGKKFVFGESVNTVEGKMIVGTTEYVQPYTLAYDFNENGDATSVTYNFITTGNRDVNKNYLYNEIINFCDGAVVNDLNDASVNNVINSYGTVEMNNCNGILRYYTKSGSLTLNNCSGSYVDSSGGHTYITNGNFTLANVQNCLGSGRTNITVYSGSFADGYVAQNVPTSILSGNSAWISSGSKQVTDEVNGIVYTITRTGSTNVWVVTSAPVAE